MSSPQTDDSAEIQTWLIHASDPAAASVPAKDSLGGNPALAADQVWPHCEQCQTPMNLYLQLDLKPEFGLPFEAHSHLLFFACLTHADPPMPPLTPALSGQLPETYWQRPESDREYCQYRLWLNRPASDTVVHPSEPALKYQRLDFEATPETLESSGRVQLGSQGFKLGGAPSWAQDPENYTCACGAPMAFVLQIPADFEFAKTPEGPRQTNSYNEQSYLLFLGNEIYIMACTAQCKPEALWPVAQN